MQVNTAMLIKHCNERLPPASRAWMTPLCSEARIHGRLGWKDNPLTLLLLVSNFVSIWVARVQMQRSSWMIVARWAHRSMPSTKEGRWTATGQLQAGMLRT